MFDLFLDIFSYKENALTRLDPRVKILASLTAIVCILLSTRVILPLGAFTICIAIFFRLRIPLKLILGRLTLPLMFVLVLVLLQALNGVSVLHAGFLLASKVMGSLSIVILLGTVTPAHKIFGALRSLKIPQGWVELAMLMYRSIFILLEHASEGACAQRVRLGYLGLRRSLSSLGVLAGSVLVRSMDQSMQTHEAMVLRGYTGKVPGEPLPGLTARETLCTLAACLAVIGALCIQEWK